MGTSLSWFAVRGRTAEAILRDLGLKHVGKEHQKSPFCGGALPSGWYFIFNIPVDLAKEITGYSYEETPEIAFDNFVKPTFFQRILGR